MDYNIKIIHQNPKRIALALYVTWSDARAFFYFVLHIVAQRFHLRIWRAFTHDKKIGGRIVQMTKVKQTNIMPFFVLQTFYNKLCKYLATYRDYWFGFQNIKMLIWCSIYLQYFGRITICKRNFLVFYNIFRKKYLQR